MERIESVRLKADEGKWLTQSSEEVNERVFVEVVDCRSEFAAEWIEVSNAWKEQWELDHPLAEPIEETETVGGMDVE